MLCTAQFRGSYWSFAVDGARVESIDSAAPLLSRRERPVELCFSPQPTRVLRATPAIAARVEAMGERRDDADLTVVDVSPAA